MDTLARIAAETAAERQQKQARLGRGWVLAVSAAGKCIVAASAICAVGFGSRALSPLRCRSPHLQATNGHANGHANGTAAAKPERREQEEQQAAANGGDANVTVGRALRSGKVVAYT